MPKQCTVLGCSVKSFVIVHNNILPNYRSMHQRWSKLDRGST